MTGIVRCAPGSSPVYWIGSLFRTYCPTIPHLFCVILVLAIGCTSAEALAVNTESPEVRKLIEQGLSYLSGKTDRRLGGKCLVALAFHKDGASLEHPRIREAIEACEAFTEQDFSNEDENYSIALAIIFLAELKSEAHRPLLTRFAKVMFQRQKPHGGWGYSANPVGDTSQTQYAVLSYWELLQSGVSPKVGSVESCLNWLLRTQDPNGGWGYQANDPGSMQRIKQNKTTQSMAAAGLGSTLILADMLGLAEINNASAENSASPSVLQRADNPARNKGKRLHGSGVNRQRLLETITSGQAWFNEVVDEKKNTFPCYVLYSIERYKSFEELLSGNANPEPDWYQKGYEYLKDKQQAHGGWNGRSGEPCATAFAVLFLMRSTQKSIRASLGEGTLVGGRGLQADLSRMKLERGRLVTKPKAAKVSELLSILNNSAPEAVEKLLSNPDTLRIDKAGPEDSRRLQQIIKSGVPAARIMSVRVLAELRDLDHVPTLLFAMTDPDKRVVREARDGLRFISRKFGGYGLSDNFSDKQRYDVIDKWKRWYRRVRPDAPPLP